MLTIKGTPENLVDLYNRYKATARKIFQNMQNFSFEATIPANTDILSFQKIPRTIIYIIEGFCKLQQDNKSVRLYSDADFIIREDRYDATWSLTSEFITKAAFFDPKVFLDAACADAATLQHWFEVLTLENRINLSLCAYYLQQDIKTDFKYREFNKDDIIIQEGDTTSQEIFEMVSGSAIVLRDNREIGIINAGEPFGEISFLTASPRTATVKALEHCFVRIATKEQFQQLILSNPQLIITISKALADRVIQLNRRITEQPG